MSSLPGPSQARGQLSLKWFLTLSFLALGVLLVIGYSWLSVQFFVRGMDSIMASNMEHAALHHLDFEARGRQHPERRPRGYHFARHWEQMPAEIRAVFGEPPKTAGMLYKVDPSGWLQRPDVMHFAIRLQLEGETLFVARTVSAAETSKLIGNSAKQSLRMLLTISAAIGLTLAVIIWLLLRRVSRPVKALGRWTGSLDADRLNEAPPDFAYPELNALAELIRSSLSSVQDTLEREHRFLRHASHELRTPIAVIRSNLELLRRLQESTANPVDARQHQVIERMERASLNMQHLTETLLWLSRDDREMPAAHPVRIHVLIRELVTEMRYLLNEKQVSVSLVTAPFELALPEVPARIVLGNLIRNAFQHTWEGEVRIRQSDDRVEILNSRPQNPDETYQSQGFGLGLQLTTRLTERLGWDYANENGEAGYRVVLRLRDGYARRDHTAATEAPRSPPCHSLASPPDDPIPVAASRHPRGDGR